MKKDFFFHPKFEADFEWMTFQLRLGSVRPHNKKQISEGLRDMSPESIRNRFLGSKRDFTDRELQYLTQLDGYNHYALGIEEREGKKKGVAVVRLVRSSLNHDEAEVAVTIIDPYQKKGLGAFLLNLILLAAKERDLKKLSFTFLPQNEGIVKLIKKVGPAYQGAINKDYVQYFVDLDSVTTEEIKSRLAPILPMIDSFH